MPIDEATRNAAISNIESHIKEVESLMYSVAKKIGQRAHNHDASKLEQPELDLFAEWGPKLKQMEYGSEEYKSALVQMGTALKHHYENNRHHPEHYDNGVDGMTLVDLVEMVCDWIISSRRAGGHCLDSLEHNRKRFNLSPQLVRIIANTVDILED